MEKPKTNQYYYNSDEYVERLADLEEKKQEILKQKSIEAKKKKRREKQIQKIFRSVYTIDRCGKENELVVNSLIDRASFLATELESIEQTLQKEGFMDFFTQGLQTMWREHPLSKVHSQHSKSYRETIKQLDSYCKSSVSGEKDYNPVTELISKANKVRDKYKQ